MLANQGETQAMTGHQRALVLGGGVVGMACALRLQLSGIPCVLVDPMRERDAATFGNAGHLAIEQVAPLASWSTLLSLPRRWFGRGGPVDVPRPFAILSWLLRFLTASSPARHARGKEALRALLADAIPAWQRIWDRIGGHHLMREDGHLVVWESESAAKRGRDGWLNADIGQATVAPMSPSELKTCAVQLSRPLVDGLRFTGSGQINDLGGMLETMRNAFVAAGGGVLHAEAKALVKRGRRVDVVLADGNVLEADHVLVAAGIGSSALMASAGEPAPLIAERGYHVHWAKHGWSETSPPVVFEDRSVILTRFDNGLRLAGFVEFVPPGSPPDPRKWQRLREHARALGLPVEGDGVEWVGTRPTLPDYLPAIGRSDVADNLFYAFGHQHLGLTLAAVTAERIAAIIGQGQGAATAAVDAFSLTRFR